MTDIQRSYKRFADVTTPLLLQHYERIRTAADSDGAAHHILKLYASIYQTFDAVVAEELHDALVDWLTRK